MAEAVESLSDHFALALSSSMIQTPTLAAPADSLPAEEQYAEKEHDEAEM